MPAPLHIQHVVLSLQPGGLENGVVNVANGLAADEFRSSVCCLKFGGEFVARLRPDAIAVHEMGLAKGNDPWLPLRLARLFRRTRTDVVHTRNAESFYYGFLGAKLAGIPHIVHSEHGRTFDDRAIRYRVQRLFSRGTERIFAVTEQLRRDLVAHVGIPAQRIEVLYNGVDFARFAPADPHLTRARLGIPADVLLVGSVGRLAAVKNYALLVRAVAALGMDNVQLCFVGDGPERAALEALARELGIAGKVTFLGHRDDVSDILGAMDVFVLPSVSEGMSNTLLEAMAAGVAPVASAVGGNPEIVRDGVDGLLFASNDLAGLSECLRRLLTDVALRERFGMAARARVLEQFALEGMIARYENLYRSLGAAARAR